MTSGQQQRRNAGLPRRLAFLAATVLSAVLLFSVEPMITRMALPRFGGSAAVWSVAIAFFQGALLIGYLYAHWLVRAVPLRPGVFVHLGVLGAAWLVLPLKIDDALSPAWAEPLRLLAAFTVSVGLPFAALSANAPLLQAWFATSRIPGKHDPYPLYAASNLGSFAALLAYPLVVEPNATLAGQAGLWAAGYGLLMGLVALAGLGAGLGRERLHAPAPMDWRHAPVWMGLPAIPSAGLVAVTAHLSTDVAAAPFLWVVPLALYLLTFVIAFSGGRGVSVRLAGRVALPALVGLAVVVGFSLRFGLVPDIVLHLGVFFILSLACHGRVAALRPPADDLTGFYLALSAGGLVGGLSAALLAPMLFSFIAEYPLVLVMAALALGQGRLRWPLAGAVALILAVGLLTPWTVRTRETHRSFFGLHSIEETKDGQFRVLRHGLEIHGAQRIRDAAGQPVTGKPKPLSFYHEDSPISEAIDAARAARGGGALRIGVIGLGTGSIACLGEAMDTIDFYEIDPVIIGLAQDPAKFSFLSACAPKARIIEGDARRTLARGGEAYDILIVDAFSSDSIPLHLLTREAFRTYLDRIGPQGTILMHISNDHLRLNDIVATTARMLGLSILINEEEEDAEAQKAFLFQPAVAILARQQQDFGVLNASDDWVAPEPRADIRPWSDDYSNLLAAVYDRYSRR